MTTSRDRRGLVVGALLLAAVVVAGCPAPVEQDEECRVYLACFFPGGVSQYPDETFDGGFRTDPETGRRTPIVLDYTGFDEEATKRAIFDAYDTDGYCWRKKLDPLTQEDANEALHTQCRRACAKVLAADCDRHRDFVATGAGVPPVCLDSAVPDDDLTAHDTALTCDEVRATAAIEPVP